MKIISWNLANRVRKQQLQLDALVSREPDLIGLQEVTSRTLPLWVEGLQRAGYKHVISAFSLHGGNNSGLTYRTSPIWNSDCFSMAARSCRSMFPYNFMA